MRGAGQRAASGSLLAAVLLGAWGWALRVTGRFARQIPGSCAKAPSDPDRPGADKPDPGVLARVHLDGHLQLYLVRQDGRGYDVSPYTHAPNYFAWQDPQGAGCSGSTGRTSEVYGPAWVWPAAALARLSESLGGDIVTYLLTQRFLAAGLHMANTLLIWNLAGKLMPAQPGRAPGGHGVLRLVPADCLGVRQQPPQRRADGPGSLSRVWCHLKGMAQAHRPGRGLGWWQAAIVALTLAATGEADRLRADPGYMMLLFRTVDAAHPWRRRVAIGAQAGALALGLSALLYGPTGKDWSRSKPLIAAPGNERYVNSLGDVVRYRVPDASIRLGSRSALAGRATWRS